ncbi:UbiA prenyltransferase family protein [Maribacter antarcticus]|uniref:hypothetical protein n=1 Tax=Maribacter antarcticus TaxID=505250 RepID=UPI00047A6495|nr:hypothetical protein [Maribacter antarcticus]
MKILKGVFDFYLDASIHVAFAVLALMRVTTLSLNIPPDLHLSWFLFFGTIICYNFVKYGVEAKKYVLVANRYHKNIQFFSFISAAFMLYHAYFLSHEVWIAIAVLALVSGLYTLPVLPRSKNLRSWGGFKIFIVALVWTGATVLLPVLSQDYELSWNVQIVSLQRFIFVLVLLIPFEIRDLQYDDPELKTLPQRFGVSNTKVFGFFLVLLFFFITFFKDEISVTDLVSKGVLFLVLCSLLKATKRNQAAYFSSFWVEAIPVGWYLILLVVGLF